MTHRSTATPTTSADAEGTETKTVDAELAPPAFAAVKGENCRGCWMLTASGACLYQGLLCLAVCRPVDNTETVFLKKNEEGEAMTTEWVVQNRRTATGTPYDDDHIELEFGLVGGGDVKWRKIRYWHPRRCPNCNSERRGDYCSRCGTRMSEAEVVGGWGAKPAKPKTKAKKPTPARSRSRHSKG